MDKATQLECELGKGHTWKSGKCVAPTKGSKAFKYTGKDQTFTFPDGIKTAFVRARAHARKSVCVQAADPHDCSLQLSVRAHTHG